MVFEKIIDGSNDNLDILYRLLYARGFLVEKDEKGIYMSDNAFDASKASRYPTEDSDWKKLLQYMTGMILVEKDRIVSCTKKFSAQRTFDDLFTKGGYVGYETTMFQSHSPLSRFKRNAFPPKIRTMDLEPFVAMYVKALSAIQFETFLSCQGHTKDWWGQPTSRCKLWIVFANQYFTAFHNALWATDRELRGFKLKWHTNQHKISIALTEETVDDIYAKVIRAGQYLYEHRFVLRKVRKEVAGKLTREDNKLDDKELKTRMIDLIKNI